MNMQGIAHHTARGCADGGYTTWEEPVLDGPLTLAQIATLANADGSLRIGANVEHEQLLTGLIDYEQALRHYAPLVLDPEAAAAVLAAQTRTGAPITITKHSGSSSLCDHVTRKPVVHIAGDFSQILAAAGYRSGWTR